MSDRTPFARLIEAHPLLFPLFVYAVCFFVYSAVADISTLLGFGAGFNRYLFPLPLALVLWLGCRSWSKRIAGAARTPDGR
jgi:hypothetical protein